MTDALQDRIEKHETLVAVVCSTLTLWANYDRAELDRFVTEQMYYPSHMGTDEIEETTAEWESRLTEAMQKRKNR